MSIEFHCPKCKASVRAPDEAGGKSSHCPQCNVRLIVPEIPIPHQTPVETDLPPERPDFATTPEAAITPATADLETAGPFPPVVQPEREPSPTLKRLLRRRQQQFPAWIIPIAFGGIIMAALVYFYWDIQPELSGKLSASIVPDPVFQIQPISRESIPADKQVQDVVLADLAKQAYTFNSTHIQCLFHGDPGGLKIQIQPASRTMIVRVNLRKKTLLRQFLLDHNAELMKVKQDKLESSLKDFFEEWAAAINENKPVDDPLRFFYNIGLNTQVGELGYHIRARYAQNIYQCVYEDEHGVYFALPQSAQSFEIVGRKLEKGQTLLPVNYKVTISTTAEATANHQ